MFPSVQRDLLTASIAAVFASVMLYAGWALPLGTALRMGPGYIPRLVGLSLIGVALLLLGRAVLNWRLDRRGEAHPMAVNWKGLITIGAGALSFAVLIQHYGLLASAVAAVVITSLAQTAHSFIERFVVAGVLAGFSSLVFVVALELPLPILPSF
ncbi:tripartite tricarboxylate transporter TctB family protein [Ancylobacter sp. G4_0304]|uniref:tripartite tricarboxylate transporter TctB family protein n=1 Tax=Ancylobacter sp. G4_0304 TaxID=3114289 RepID=UPI0039C69A89